MPKPNRGYAVRPQQVLKRALKNLVRRQLARQGRHLTYVPLESVTGLDLAHDLSMLITTPQPVIFDVGANVGQSIDFFRSVFAQAKIYAFEPSSACFAQLAARFCDPSIELRQCALGASPGTCELEVYEFSVLNSVLPMDRTPTNRFHDRRPIGTETVPLLTLDGVMAERAVSHIDLLKVDTQGYDLQVLRGAEELLAEKRVSLVQVELNFLPMYSGQARAHEVADHLHDRGFWLVDYYEKFRQNQCLAWCTALFRAAQR
jgi:FkbM family methyltransferase